jgi:hypothetical protein
LGVAITETSPPVQTLRFFQHAKAGGERAAVRKIPAPRREAEKLWLRPREKRKRISPFDACRRQTYRKMRYAGKERANFFENLMTQLKAPAIAASKPADASALWSV